MYWYQFEHWRVKEVMPYGKLLRKLDESNSEAG